MEKGNCMEEGSEKCEPAVQKVSDFKQLEETVDRTVEIAYRVLGSIKETVNTINGIDECNAECVEATKEPATRILKLEGKIKGIKQTLIVIEHNNDEIKTLFK